ncbi:MAG TPA: J domain-containing protein [Steroidobacteraceae bacterium]
MSRNTLQISAGQAGPTLTPQQKRFNTLIRQIEQARQTLAAWHDNIGLYRQAHAQVLLPLESELMAARRRWVFALDELLGLRGWTKAERDTLSELVCDTAGALLHARDDDEELKALFAKHAEVDFDTERQQMVRAMKDMTEAVTGLDLGDDEGIDTHADLFERMQQGLREREAAEESERDDQAARRRKNAAQQRREAEAQEATQSVREIFRKLASALHPDRETDTRQREVKTVLMQKVNQAYAANDLLTLLELQLQIEQIDAGHIANASAQRLKHYNKVLNEQLGELRAEVERVEMGFRIDFGLEAGWGLNPRKLGELLEHNARQVRCELNQQQRDMRMLADPTATKRWLKRQRQLLREHEFDFERF